MAAQTGNAAVQYRPFQRNGDEGLQLSAQGQLLLALSTPGERTSVADVLGYEALLQEATRPVPGGLADGGEPQLVRSLLYYWLLFSSTQPYQGSGIEGVLLCWVPE